MTGRVLDQVQLFDCRSIAEIVERVAARCATLPPGTWVLGRGWDESLLAERRHPTRHDLDPVSPEHPVLLERVWNKLVCNGAALRAAGVQRETPDPAGTLYAGLVRARRRRPSDGPLPRPREGADLELHPRADRGRLGDGGRDGVPRVQPRRPHRASASPVSRRRRSARTSRRSARAVLSVRVDMMMAGWGFGTAADEVGLRERLEQVGAQTGFGGDWLRLGGVKLLPDGGIGDRTARIFEPYLAEPGSHGTWVIDPERAARHRPLLSRPRLGHRHAHVRRRGPGGDRRGVRGGAGCEPETVGAPPRAPRVLPDARARSS